MPPAALRIAAIHNGELDQAPARLIIEALRDESASTLEFTEQEDFDAFPDVLELSAWRRRQGELETQWSQYRDQPRSDLVSTLGRAAFEAKLRASATRRSDMWKVRQIEKVVTAKHIRAWRDFLASTDAELLVLESDAGLTDDTTAAIGRLTTSPATDPRYVNLAGGLDIHDLGIDHLIGNAWPVDASLMEFHRPVTNTSCAYLINRPMAQLLIDHLHQAPADAELGIDWLFNATFLANQGTRIQCLHARPPVIIHGSLHGLTTSWHPQR